MQVSILTLFPQMFSGPFSESIIKRAVEKEIISINLVNIRDFSDDKHHTTDQPPYGGGPGMVLMVEPIDKAIEHIRAKVEGLRSKSDRVKKHRPSTPDPRPSKIVLLSAKGSPYTQAKAVEYSKLDHLVLICGHYEGVDERVVEHLVDEELRIGDYVLTGGEIPAMAITDSVVRLIPGVVGDDQSIVTESHSKAGYLEYPQYTRPAEYKGWKVPDTLLSGNHSEIENWRTQHSS